MRGGGDFRVSEKTNNVYASAAPCVTPRTTTAAAAYRVGLVFLEIVCDPDAAREDRSTSGCIVYYIVGRIILYYYISIQTSVFDGLNV